jgi:hypothetical protein
MGVRVGRGVGSRDTFVFVKQARLKLSNNPPKTSQGLDSILVNLSLQVDKNNQGECNIETIERQQAP